MNTNVLANGSLSLLPKFPSSYNEPWTIWHPQTEIPSPTYANLYNLITQPAIHAHWTQPHGLQPIPCLSPQAFDDVDWDATASFMHSLPPGKCRRCTKHASKNCGVGATLLLWNYQCNADCPQCSLPEDTAHDLQCQAPDVTCLWDMHLANLDASLCNMSTPDNLQLTITSRLQAWHTSTPFLSHPAWPPALRDVIQHQDTIDWKAFLEGLPSKSWQLYIMTHASMPTSYKTSTT